MKRAITMTILGVCLPLISMAQTLDDIGKIVVGVKVLPGATKETLANKDYLQNKLTNLAANAGFSSYGNNAFFITPSITINDLQVAEGGMKNIYVCFAEIFLNVQEGDNGTVFASTSYQFKGSGTSKEAAVKNGLQKISYGNLRPFFDEARTGILNYYAAMQDKLFANAEMLCQNREYDAAIACLLSIPEELFEPYQKAYAKACDIYRERDAYVAEQIAIEIRELNNEVLVKARSLMAAHDAVGTLETLWDYRIANTDQDNEYVQLVKTAEARISAEEQAILEKEKRDYEERRMKEEREYQDMRRREERAYADSRREYEDNLQDRRQAHADEVSFRNRQLDLENKRADYERANQREMTEAVKTIALEYYKNYNAY